MMEKVTLWGWYNYKPDLFEEMIIPADLKKQLAIDTILMRCGEFNIIYSNPEFLKLAIKNWSERHLRQFERMKEALNEEYNPLHNYDRYEEYQDKSKGSSANTGTNKTTQNNSGSASGTVTNTVSADNSSTYQPDNRSEESKSTSAKSTIEDANNGSANYSDEFNHTAHLFGNIGVTTSATMLTEEINVRSAFGIYDLIAASFVEEFCIALY